jgi:hypothetical protein
MNDAGRSPEKDFAMSTTSDRSMLPRRQFLRRMAGTAGGLLVTAVAAACGANKSSSATPASSAPAAPSTAKAGAPATAAATVAAPGTAKAAATEVSAAPAPAPTTAAKTTAPAGATGAATGATFDAAKELAISFSYVADTTAGGNPPPGGGNPPPGGGGGGRGGGIKNPYVVVWIENAAGAPVRSISLNYQAGRGEQYLRDLTRWSRTAQASASVATISSATKVPGTYKIVWDGNDDKKAPVAQGDYFVCIEAAREHGPYEIVREQVSIGAEPFVKPLAAKGELQDVTVELRARS